MPVIASGEDSGQGLDVVVTADGDHEAHAAAHVVLQRRQHRRPGGVGNADHADAAIRAAGEVAHGVGDVARVLGPNLERPQIGDVRHQDREAGAGEGVGEGDQARVVLAVGDHPRHQDDACLGRHPRAVEVTGALSAVDAVGDRRPARRWGRALEAALLVARGHVGKQPRRLYRATRGTRTKHRR